MIRYQEIKKINIDEIKDIYKSQSWIAYLSDDNKLLNAFTNSLLTIGAYDESILIGFIRVIGDGEHIVLIQDLILKPEYMYQGIGSKLLKHIMDKYASVRSLMVITDIDDKISNSFYQKNKLKPLNSNGMICYIK